MKEFEPRIICFLCKWCSYTCVDLAGVGRMQYPPNLFVVRVSCSGRIDPAIIFDALVEGADGVVVIGCNIGGVNCIAGNAQTKRKFALTERLVEKSGLESGRLMLDWVSASDGESFAKEMRKFNEQIRKLGPSPLSGDSPNPDLLLNMRAAGAAAEDFRLRALVGKEEKLITECNVYGDQITQKEFDEKMAEAVESEFERHKIRLALGEEPSSVKKLSERLGMEPQGILKHIVVMRQRGWVDIHGIQGNSPIYKAQEALP